MGKGKGFKLNGCATHARYYQPQIERRIGYRLESIKDMVTAANADWVALTHDEKQWWQTEAKRLERAEPPRLPYTDEAGRARVAAVGPRPDVALESPQAAKAPKRSLNQILAQKDAENRTCMQRGDLEEKMKRDSNMMVLRLNPVGYEHHMLTDWISSLSFTIGHVVPFFRDEEDRVTAPAEIALVRLNLRDGYTFERHWIVDPEDDFLDDARHVRKADYAFRRKHAIGFRPDEVQRHRRHYSTDMNQLIKDFLNVTANPGSAALGKDQHNFYIYPSERVSDDVQQCLEWLRGRRDDQLGLPTDIVRRPSTPELPCIDKENVRFINCLNAGLRFSMTTLVGRPDGERRYEQLFEQPLEVIVEKGVEQQATKLCPYHQGKGRQPLKPHYCALTVAYALAYEMVRDLDWLWDCIDLQSDAFEPQPSMVLLYPSDDEGDDKPAAPPDTDEQLELELGGVVGSQEAAVVQSTPPDEQSSTDAAKAADRSIPSAPAGKPATADWTRGIGRGLPLRRPPSTTLRPG